MTRAVLIRSIFAIIAVLLALWLIALIAALGGFGASSHIIYEYMKDFIIIPITVAAAMLAYIFQLRQNFLTSLRELWHSAIDARIAAVKYTYDPKPDFESFSQAHGVLSKAIDQMRGVYRNVEETDESTGFFPFEPLHDIRRSLDQLNKSAFSDAARKEERIKIRNAWLAFRWIFLREFGTPASTYTICKSDAVDPRRRPKAAGGGN